MTFPNTQHHLHISKMGKCTKRKPSQYAAYFRNTRLACTLSYPQSTQSYSSYQVIICGMKYGKRHLSTQFQLERSCFGAPEIIQWLSILPCMWLTVRSPAPSMVPWALTREITKHRARSNTWAHLAVAQKPKHHINQTAPQLTKLLPSQSF